MAGPKGGNDRGWVYVLLLQNKRFETPSWKLKMRQAALKLTWIMAWWMVSAGTATASFYTATRSPKKLNMWMKIRKGLTHEFT